MCLSDIEDDIRPCGDNDVHKGLQELTDLFLVSKRTRKTRDSIAVLSSSIYSLKAYSTIAHSLLQRRSNFPLNYKDMFGVGKKSIESLQSLVVNADKAQKKAFSLARNEGFSFRIEVSIRPHFTDTIRRQGHFNDLVLLACVSLCEFCYIHKPKVILIPSSLVETESMKLIHEARDLLRTRQAIKFDVRFKCKRATEWLRFHLSLMLITIGICPSFEVKYINQWLKNEDRFDPNSRVKPNPSVIGQISSDDESKDKFSWLLKRTLIGLKFPSEVASEIESVLKKFLKDPTKIDCRDVYIALPLDLKHMLAYNLWRNIIPTMLELNKADDKTEEEITYVEKEDNDSLFHYDGEWSPDNAPDWSEFTKHAPAHPLGLSLTFLTKVSNYWMHPRQAFNQMILSNFVLECHKSQILSHNNIEDMATLKYLSECSHIGKILTINELYHICSNVSRNSYTRGRQSESYYLQILCECYNFPNNEQQFETEGETKDLERNTILNQVLQLDLVITVSANGYEKKLQRYADNSYIDVVLPSNILQTGMIPSFEIVYTNTNLFHVLSKSFNSVEASCVRTMLLVCLRKMGPNLQYIFLTDDGISNPSFLGIRSLDHLLTKYPLLMGNINGTDTPTFVMPEIDHHYQQVIFAITSVVYESNIMFYDEKRETTFFFAYLEQRSIRYKHPGLNILPKSKPLNQLIFRLGLDGKYNLVKIRNEYGKNSTANSFSPIGGAFREVHRLKDILPHKKQSRLCKSFYKVLEKLLNELDEHYTEESEFDREDPLGFRLFMSEISCSRDDSLDFEGFHKDVVVQCPMLGMSMRVLSKYLNDADLHVLDHKFLCPITCLKYSNLTFGVIDSTNGTKITYYYGHNVPDQQVVCLKHPGYCILIHRPRVIYFYTNATSCRYWAPIDESDVQEKDKWWSHSNQIFGKYTHVGIQCFKRYLRIMNEAYKLNAFLSVENVQNFDYRPEPPNKTIIGKGITCNSGNLLYYSQWGTVHHAVVLIYHGECIGNTWDVCIVHHPQLDPIVAKKHLMENVLEFAPATGLYRPHSIRGIQIEACESGVLMILCAYLGSKCQTFQKFKEVMEKVEGEANISRKVRRWMYTVLCMNKESHNLEQSYQVPIWIRQMTLEEEFVNTPESSSMPNVNSFPPQKEMKKIIFRKSSQYAPNKETKHNFDFQMGIKKCRSRWAGKHHQIRKEHRAT